MYLYVVLVSVIGIWPDMSAVPCDFDDLVMAKM